MFGNHLVMGAILTLVTSGPVWSQFPLGSGRKPEIAYNASIDRYLAAWEVGYVGATVLVNADGTLGATGALPGPNQIGGIYPIAYTGDPSIAAIQSGPVKFAVVTGGGLWVSYFPLLTAVDGHGRVIGTMAVDPGWPDLASIDVGGEATNSDDDVVVVWREQYRQAVRLAECHPATLTTLQLVDLTTGTDDRRVAIASTGGMTGRYLVTWERWANGSADVYGAVIDRDLRVLVSPFPIAQDTAHETHADVDGDGTDWVVAYQRLADQPRQDSDILCRRVTFEANTATAHVSAAVLVEGDPAANGTEPVVSWSGESVQIGYVDSATGGGLFAVSLETFGCQPCEGQSVQALPAGDLRLAATGASGRGVRGGLAVWSRSPQIHADFFAVVDGSVRDLGGGCGGGGIADATCAAVGAPAFGMRVRQAAPMASGWLALGVAPPINFACGGCTLVPNPVAVLPAVTDARGNVEVSFQLGNNPSQRGARLQAQWLVIAPGGCSSLGLSFSNAIEVEIE